MTEHDMKLLNDWQSSPDIQVEQIEFGLNSLVSDLEIVSRTRDGVRQIGRNYDWLMQTLARFENVMLEYERRSAA